MHWVIPKTAAKRKGAARLQRVFAKVIGRGKVAASQRTGSVGGVWSALADRLCAACPLTLSQTGLDYNQKMIRFQKYYSKIVGDFFTLPQNPLTTT